MHDHDPTEDLGLTCPSGTNFYVCKNDPDRFIGCCAINPCGLRKGLCPDQHLKPATFDKAYEEYISPQACINDNVDVAWHACSWSISSFMGCCAVDPCKGGCPAKQLRAAKLSDNARNAECFLGGDDEYEPKTSYTSSSSMDPTTSMSACSTTTASTTTVSTTASSFTTSIVTTSASSTTMASSPSPTSAPPKGRGGPELKYLWILLLLVVPILYCARRAFMKRSKLREAKRNMYNSDRFCLSSDSDSKENTPEPRTASHPNPPAERVPSPVTKEEVHGTIRHNVNAGSQRIKRKAVPQTNPSIDMRDNRPRLPRQDLVNPARNDTKTEKRRVVDETDIQQTHSAEPTQSQTSHLVNMRPDRSLPFERGLPYPPQLDVQTGDGRTTKQKEFPQEDPLFKRHNDPCSLREALPRKKLFILPGEDSIFPFRSSQKPRNDDIGRAHGLPRGNVPVSIKPQVGGPDKDNEDLYRSELNWTGFRSGSLKVTNPDPREESPEASEASEAPEAPTAPAAPKTSRVPRRGRYQKRQRPQIPRKPLSPLSEKSLE